MALRALQGPTGGGSPVGGTGTTNTIPRWTGPSTLGDSLLSQSGAFINAASNALVIDTGNVRTGVGAAPDRTFTVYAASGPILNIKTGTAGAMQGMLGISEVDAAVFFGAYSNHPLILRTNNTEQVRVTATGNVGIGTASPGYKLDVAGVINTTDQVRVYSSATSSDVRLNAGFGGTVAGLGTVGAQPFMFFTSNTERARIDSAGNFGLNTSTASSGFATMTLNGSTAGAKANNCGLQLNYNTGGFGGGSITTVGAAGGGLDFWTYTGNIGSEIYQRVYRIDSTGNLILNTANTGATIQAAGSQQGLKLPATPGNADTQTLDCYQELGWTPTLSAAATWGGTAPTVNFANYTRVGRLIFFEIELAPTAATAFSATWGSTSFTLPVSAPRSTAIAVNRNAASANAVTNGANLLLPTFALVAENMRVSGVYAI